MGGKRVVKEVVKEAGQLSWVWVVWQVTEREVVKKRVGESSCGSCVWQSGRKRDGQRGG